MRLKKDLFLNENRPKEIITDIHLNKIIVITFRSIPKTEDHFNLQSARLPKIIHPINTWKINLPLTHSQKIKVSLANIILMILNQNKLLLFHLPFWSRQWYALCEENRKNTKSTFTKMR